MPFGEPVAGLSWTGLTATQTTHSRPMKITGSLSEILNQKSSKVWTVSPQSTVFKAISLMSEKNVGALPVVNRSRIVGMLSERDYTRKVILHGKSSHTTRVGEIMSQPVIAVSPEMAIDRAMQLMTSRRIRHLPVVTDDDKKLIGIISIGDLVNWTLSAQESAIWQLENYIVSAYPG